MEKTHTEKKQPVVAFIWDFTVDPLTLHGWADGLYAALQILSHKYGWFIKVIAHDNPNEIYKEIKNLSPDFILGWGSLDRPSFAGIKEFGVPTGLCFAGGPTQHPQSDNFDVIFVENDIYKKAFKRQSVNVHKAFGTNNMLFTPQPLRKKYLGFYPAAYANWKRHDLFAKALGQFGVTAGRILENEVHNMEVCIKEGCVVLPELPYHAIMWLYNQSKHTVITANNNGGSQRAVLESMACGVWPIVMSDSEKCSEFVREANFGSIVSPTPTAIKDEIQRLSTVKYNPDLGVNFIERKYSAEKYADTLYREITIF